MEEDSEVGETPPNVKTLVELATPTPTMWADEKNGAIAIPVPTAKDPVTVYYVDYVRLMTPLNLLSWVVHLAGKPWMDRKRLREFIRLVCKTLNFKLPNT